MTMRCPENRAGVNHVTLTEHIAFLQFVISVRHLLHRKETFWEKRKISQENITSERGILLRTNRSIQVEGAFGLLKNDFGFRRFLTTGKRMSGGELFFLALGFNLKKRWMKQENSREKTHYSEKKAA